MSAPDPTNKQKIRIEIISFAYKVNMPPKANLLFDVRFIDNPFWVEHLRPLNGLNKNVQDFVLGQGAARTFIDAFSAMIKVILPMHIASIANKTGTPSEVEAIFTIAFGCTGGQHRSAAIAEESARLINKLFPQYPLTVWHREIAAEGSVLPPAEHKITNEELRS